MDVSGGAVVAGGAVVVPASASVVFDVESSIPHAATMMEKPAINTSSRLDEVIGELSQPEPPTPSRNDSDTMSVRFSPGTPLAFDT